MPEDTHYLKTELERLIAEDPTVLNFLRQAASDGVWYWDLEQPEHEWMSPEFWELLGVDPETKSHFASEWQDLIFEEDLQVAQENFEKHCADPNYKYDQVVRYRHADGSTIWVRCRGTAVRNASGDPVRLLGTHTDYTQLMQAQTTLDQTNLRLKTILDTASAGIIALGSDKQIIEINLAGRHLLGTFDQEVPFLWPSNIEFLEPERLQPLPADRDPIRRALRGQDMRNETNLMTRAKGSSQRYVNFSSSKIRDPKSEVDTVLILEDISELEQNRQQIERASRLDALGQLTGGIAHDFNNLLATIQYAVQLTLDHDLPEKSRRYLETAHGALNRGTKLTSRLLAFARPQPGLAHARQVTEIFQELHDLIAPTIEETIRFDIEEIDPALSIYCDQSQLENALVNLVLNSRDAIIRAKTGDRISVSARGLSDEDLGPEDDNPGSTAHITRGVRMQRNASTENDDGKSLRFVEISVTDNGPGMSDEIKRRAIDPFFTTKDLGTGTGLGLSTVYGFIQQAAGEFRIYSEADQGTTIRLMLPRGQTDGQREDPVSKEPAPLGGGQTILVVEDEPWLLEMMEDMLVNLNYKVIKKSSSEEALKILDAKESFDVLLTDIVMPGNINGFELARKMREERPDLAVVYMSGYSGFDTQEMGTAVAPMVNKPCPPERISKAIREALSLEKPTG